MSDMARGAEAFLQTWERAVGVTNDGCRDRRVLKGIGVYRNLRKGMTTTAVLKKAGQPHSRLGRTYSYCAESRAGEKVEVKLVFTAKGRVKRVTA